MEITNFGVRDDLEETKWEVASRIGLRKILEFPKIGEESNFAISCGTEPGSAAESIPAA